MRQHRVTTLTKWALCFALLSGLMLVLFLLHRNSELEAERERGAAETSEAPARNGLVSLEDDEAERYGVKAEVARGVSWVPRVRILGRVIPNPEATVDIRSPFAGVLRPAPNSSWPALGQRVRADQMLGLIDVRVGPEVRLELKNKREEARIRQEGAEEEVKLQQSRVDSLKSVTSQQILSRGELDAALIQLAQARSHLATAKAAAELWHRALQELDRHEDDLGKTEKRRPDVKSAWLRPLVAPAEGEIADVASRPGSSVEAGAVIATIVNYRRPLIRLDVPPAVLMRGGPPPHVELQVATPSAPASVRAVLVGAAPRVDVTSQFVSYWYVAQLREEKGAALWRPGMQVVAEAPDAGATAQAAVAVPAEAVLVHEGRSLVYVRTAPEKYQRREVRILGRDSDRIVVGKREGDSFAGVSPEENVVSRGAQILLSKEFLSAVPDND